MTTGSNYSQGRRFIGPCPDSSWEVDTPTPLRHSKELFVLYCLYCGGPLGSNCQWGNLPQQFFCQHTTQIHPLRHPISNLIVILCTNHRPSLLKDPCRLEDVMMRSCHQAEAPSSEHMKPTQVPRPVSWRRTHNHILVRESCTYHHNNLPLIPQSRSEQRDKMPHSSPSEYMTRL